MDDSLENEFKKLMESVYQQIQDKQNNGELTFYQAQDLRQMFHDRLVGVDPPTGDESRWNDSGCSIGSDYQDDGWRGSSLSC
jgi:hypothetical protein